MTSTGRPRPLKAAANKVTQTLGMLTALVVAAAGFGIVTAVQGDALEGLLGAIPGAITLIGNVLMAFGIVSRAEPLVTPISDPRNDNLERLTATGSQVGRSRPTESL